MTGRGRGKKSSHLESIKSSKNATCGGRGSRSSSPLTRTANSPILNRRNRESSIDRTKKSTAIARASNDVEENQEFTLGNAW